MRKFQVLALTLITCVAFTAVANAEVSLVYYPADANSPAWGENGAGTLIADSTDRSITTLEIISAGGNFTPAGAAAGGGSCGGPGGLRVADRRRTSELCVAAGAGRQRWACAGAAQVLRPR